MSAFAGRLQLGGWRWVFLLLMTGGCLASFLAARYGLGATTRLSDVIPWGLCLGLNVFCGVALAAGATNPQNPRLSDLRHSFFPRLTRTAQVRRSPAVLPVKGRDERVPRPRPVRAAERPKTVSGFAKEKCCFEGKYGEDNRSTH